MSKFKVFKILDINFKIYYSIDIDTDDTTDDYEHFLKKIFVYLEIVKKNRFSKIISRFMSILADINLLKINIKPFSMVSREMVKKYKIEDVENAKASLTCHATTYRNTIYMSPDTSEIYNTNEKMARMIIHELTHIIRYHTDDGVKNWFNEDCTIYDKKTTYNEESLAFFFQYNAFRKNIHIYDREWDEIESHLECSYQPVVGIQNVNKINNGILLNKYNIVQYANSMLNRNYVL